MELVRSEVKGRGMGGAYFEGEGVETDDIEDNESHFGGEVSF